MNARFGHVNIISKDWKALANFYSEVFGCVPPSKENHLLGEWLEKAVGIKNANLKGVQLTLPGYKEKAPTLEIFQYEKMLDREAPIVANRIGYAHIAFEVEDVEAMFEKVLVNGGSKVGEIAQKEFKTGTLTCVYMADPEGNIIELLNWKPN